MTPRLVLTDVPGEPIVLALFSPEGPALRTPLEPLRALRLARELVAAAEGRLRVEGDR